MDDETGYYYYGARYYDPNTSVWLSVDPLAVYNPVIETEFYGDGQHNGGVFNSGNLNAYIYCYQNPVIYIDPNGKQVNVTREFRAVPNIQPQRHIPASPRTVPTVEPSPSPWYMEAMVAVGSKLAIVGAVFTPIMVGAPAPAPKLKFDPNLPNAPSNGDSNDGITLYRGVSSDYTTATKREMYNNAKFGVAIPLGEEGGHDDPDLHAKGNNNSIFTSWTTDKKVADKFARGSGGKYPGVILSKKFKFGEAYPNTSQAAQKANEGEWLVPGIVTGANVAKVKK